MNIYAFIFVSLPGNLVNSLPMPSQIRKMLTFVLRDKGMTACTIYETDLEHFDEQVIHAPGQQAVLVDFWADWCPPCLSLDPVLKKLVHEYPGQLLLAKVEVDAGENMKLAGRYQLRGFPTVILFRDGLEQGRFSGFKPAEQIRAFLAEHDIHP
jgi:putative thioredoxin